MIELKSMNANTDTSVYWKFGCYTAINDMLSMERNWIYW